MSTGNRAINALGEAVREGRDEHRRLRPACLPETYPNLALSALSPADISLGT
jgi:hypothetical protein